MSSKMRATEALDAHREVTECQIFSIYKSEKEFDAMLPMSKTLEDQSTTYGEVVGAYTINPQTKLKNFLTN